jgi:hypothetical protein
MHDKGPWGRLFYTIVGPAIPLVLIGRITRKVLFGGRNIGALLRSFPHFVVLTVAWSFGEFVGYLTGKEASGVNEFKRS